MSKYIYRFLAVLSVLSMLFVGAAAPASAAAWRDKVDPWVLQTASSGETEFLVYLTTQADLSAAQGLSTKLEKGSYVYQTLVSTAQRTQKNLLAQLTDLGVQFRPYWVANMVWVRADLDTIQLLAERGDVAHIYANPSVRLDAPTVGIPASGPKAALTGIEWNIIKVNAPDVWALGFTGQDVVIGGADTGYQWDHPALKNHYRGWSGFSADHNYNWHDAIHDSSGNPCGNDSPFPCDDYGHGTHTMGTMVGDDGGSNQIGMAPGAKWIGCRNMDDGFGTPARYIECYQWFIAPTDLNGNTPRPDLAPDVINNSWGCTFGEGCTDPNALLTVVQSLVAAGIVTAHSAGNSGSGCSTISEPAAIYDESFTVGATDSSDTIAFFSSRGPVTIDGSGRPKPDISAPGVDIRSSVPGSDYQGGWSGTSMAGPHVAGEVALLISAHPGLRGQVSQIESIIEQSAAGHTTNQGCGGDSPDDIPNNTYGWGRIDALAAVESQAHQLELNKVASAASVTPGEAITYTLTITHSLGISPTTNVVLSDTVPLGTAFLSASLPYTRDGDVIQWSFSSLDASEARSVELAVQVNITSTGTIVNQDYAVSSEQVTLVQGEPVSTQVLLVDALELNKVASTVIVFPGDLVTYTLSLTNTHTFIPGTNVVLADTLPAGSEFVSATGPYSLDGDIVHWDIPILNAGESLVVTLVVRVGAVPSAYLTNQDYSASSDQMLLVQGAPVATPIGNMLFLPLTVKGP